MTSIIDLVITHDDVIQVVLDVLELPYVGLCIVRNVLAAEDDSGLCITDQVSLEMSFTYQFIPI